MVIEGLPGSPFERLSLLKQHEDPALFERTVLDLLAEHAPPLRERIDAREFGLARPIDLIQGGLTPTVRKGWAGLSNGRFALALGDAWVLNDPLSGQGANLGSRCAFELAELIMAEESYDEAFCRRVEERLWAIAQPVVSWSNLTLGPPADEMMRVLSLATEDTRAANAFAENFNDPQAMWDMVRSPENTDAWLARFAEPVG
jgi:2-polyprenyl-6-methoxyphenol hydroxylase-like FAD-dependent oxidoreductase